jgi:catechol 2,3-dioxygenase-like lactoylglutathione lyase family enzyme
MNIQKLSPILWTKSLTETVDFYVNVLGFKAQSNFPNFVYLFREDVALMFVVPEQDLKNAGWRMRKSFSQRQN